MKKVLIVLLICLLFTKVYTQNFHNTQVHLPMKFGIIGGANLANQYYNTGLKTLITSSIIGFNVGFFLDIKVLNDKHNSHNFSKVSIVPNLLYSTQGSSYKENGRTVTLNYSYLNYPIYVQIKIGEKDGPAGIGIIYYTIEPGIHLGYLQESSAYESENQITRKLTIEKNTQNKFDYGLNLGFGLGYETNKQKLQENQGYKKTDIGYKVDDYTRKSGFLYFKIRYTYSFANALNIEGAILKNSVLQLSVGWAPYWNTK